MITLVLPWPPSVNTYWRHPTKGKLAGRHLISENGRAYRLAVYESVLRATGRVPRKLVDRLAVDISVHAPDRRRRDLDNLTKALLDALAHAGIYEDDSQIDDLRLRRAGIAAGGRVVVKIEPTQCGEQL